jgi:hypothetical protein
VPIHVALLSTTSKSALAGPPLLLPTAPTVARLPSTRRQVTVPENVPIVAKTDSGWPVGQYSK